MVDLTGKFYLLDELDEDFVKRCVRVDEYRKWEGQFVKKCLRPEEDRQGRNPRRGALHGTEAARNGIQDRETRAQLSALLADGQADSVLSTRQLVHPQHGCQGTDDRTEPYHQLEAGIHRDRTFR